MRIGIIEDDNLLRKALDTSLKNQGYTTILAGSRKEAIKNIDSSVDLLIVDIGLPDGDGINLYQELQKNGRIPAIFLTAKDDEKDMLKAFDTGADDYVVKPFSISINGIEKCIISHIPAIIYSATATNPDIPINGGTTHIPHPIAPAI